MTDRTCTINGCVKQIKARGWCNAHYKQWQKGQEFSDPTAKRPTPKRKRTKPSKPAEGELRERLDTCTERLPDGCLVWTGARNRDGYGRARSGGKRVSVHRWVYEREHGPIEPGVLIDHACWNRACVEVTHLRPATRSENGSNRAGPMGVTATRIRNVYPHGGGYRVRVMHHGERNDLGTFPTIEEARTVAEAGRLRIFGEYAGRD